MLDSLISLSDLLTRQKTQKIEIIDEVQNSKTKIGRLYKNIANGKIKTEEQAADLLGYSGPKDKNYQNLKGKLYNRMVNSIFFIDQSHALYSDKLNAAKNCYRNFAVYRILIGNQKRDVGIKVAERVFKYSKKYDFTDLNYMISAFLTSHYNSHSLQKKKYLRFKEYKVYYLKALQAENDIEEMQGDFNMALSLSSEGLSDKQVAFFEQNVKDIRVLQETIYTQRYNLYAYIYQINLCLESKNYLEILDLVEEGLYFFKKLEVESMDTVFLLTMREGLAHFMLKSYSKAEQSFKNNIAISREFTINWYSTYNYLCALSLTRGRYLKTYTTLSLIFDTGNFEKTHPLLVQQFKIKEAYIHFLVKLGKIDPSESEEKPLRKFRLNRFLNDVPTYSKDKRGVNISILIIQMLLLVQNKKHGEIIDKMDALNMYSHRYLRSDNTFRSNCFIKMLTKLPDADYHPIRWQRYVQKFRQRLDEHPFELSYHNLDLEVIPFETLYDLVVEMLDQQQGRKR